MVCSEVPPPFSEPLSGYFHSSIKSKPFAHEHFTLVQLSRELGFSDRSVLALFRSISTGFAGRQIIVRRSSLDRRTWPRRRAPAMSRHRRQPSRALPLDFNVDDDGPAADKGATSLDGARTPRAGNGGGGGGDGRGDAGEVAGKGHGKKPPPATGGGRPSPEGSGKKPSDGSTGGR
ncbi:hypothetical protein ACP4OV_019477 [Aristida adscensionis]